jgi:hypothetical protein
MPLAYLPSTSQLFFCFGYFILSPYSLVACCQLFRSLQRASDLFSPPFLHQKPSRSTLLASR